MHTCIQGAGIQDFLRARMMHRAFLCTHDAATRMPNASELHNPPARLRTVRLPPDASSLVNDADDDDDPRGGMAIILGGRRSPI